MSQVSVVIPSWNGRHLLPSCLQALSRQDVGSLEVMVVDNGSTDGTVTWLRTSHPEVRVLALPFNTGFAAAVNAGVAATQREFVLLLNNDAAPGRDYVRTLEDFLQSHARSAGCQGRILRQDDPTRVDSLGIRFNHVLRAFQEGYGQPDPGPAGPPHPIAGLTASAALYRRQALNSVADPGHPPAILDPVFFAYYEDVDLALRLAAAGWSTHLVPAVSCEHIGSATGGEGSIPKTFRLGRNYFLYLARAVGGAGLLRLAPWLLLERLRRLLTLFIHPRRDLTLLCGELAALPYLPSAWLKGFKDRHRRPEHEVAPTAWTERSDEQTRPPHRQNYPRKDPSPEN